MRTIFFLLLLANLAFFAYTRLDDGSSGEGARLSQQIRPATIKLLTPQQVAALGPAKVAALADVCMEWGPFSDADRTRALSDLEPLALGRLLTQKRVDIENTYWVYLPRQTNKAVVDRRVADLTAAGIRNVSVVDTGPQRFTISLGAFRTEEAANAFVQQIADKGVTGATAGPRQQTLTQNLLVVRDPDAGVVSRLKTLQTAYPDTEMRTGTCDKAS